MQAPAACCSMGTFTAMDFSCIYFPLSPKTRPSPHINPSPALQKEHLTGLGRRVELREEESRGRAAALPCHPKPSSPRSRLSLLAAFPPSPLLLSIQLR